MNKAETQRLLEATFDAAFDEEQFGAFAREWLDGMEYRDNQLSGARIYDAFSGHISSYKRIGKYTDPDGRELDVLIVRVKSPEKLDRARTALRDFVIRHLDEFGKDYALAAFYSPEDGGADWRFSFIKLEYEEYLDDSGKVKTSRRETPAKRYSFLVGAGEKGYTAKRQLLELMLKFYQPTVEQIEAAFSIETVTDEFFEQYKELYLTLHDYLEQQAPVKKALEAAGQDTVRFTKKLLGQIVFLYFLQKKGWLGAAPGDPIVKGKRQFIQELFDHSQAEGKNFYNDYLKYLFYEALAKERSDHYYPRFDCQIPFLNGGLFEAQHDWQSDEIQIPNRFFRNQDTTRSGDVGTGILDVFGRYNFTIKEDEPLEKEVAVDPEMLGKVFENMLDVTERKSKGAFYTPREIVHYMCRESLIHYLDTALNVYDAPRREAGSAQAALFDPNEGRLGQQVFAEGGPRITVPKTDLETFFRRGHLFLENDRRVTEAGRETKDYPFKTPASVRAQAKTIDKLLADIRICDPAIGSGAFPVGLLHEIVQARCLLQLFLKKEGRLSPYQLKRHAIENSIYGVDIDASAIDIARLRLWLSMIVDEEVFEDISALPNLDYKLVCGNSLIGVPENMVRNHTLEEEIVALKQQFIHETDDGAKKELRQTINRKIRQFLDTAEGFVHYPIDFDFKLFFSEIWQEKGGFDVIIGNPPYLRIQGIRKENSKFADYLKQEYDSATGSFDLYACFTEKGLKITNDQGGLVFIMPVKWTNANFGKGLRHFVSKKKAAQKIISFGAYQVFNASTYTGIQAFQKNVHALQYHELNRNLPTIAELEQYLNQLTSEKFRSIDPFLLTEEMWILVDSLTATILDKLNNQKVRVRDIFKNIFTGLQTSKDSVYFIMNSHDRGDCITGYSSELKKNVTLERGLVKPLLKGDQVHRYENLETNNYVVFPYHLEDDTAVLMEESYLSQLFPLGYSYLKEHEALLRERESGRFDIDGTWFQFGRGQGVNFGNIPKLFCPDISFGGNYAFDESGKFYSTATLYGYIKHEDVKHGYKFYLGLLNSSICWYYLKNTGTVLANGYFRFKPAYIEPFPLPDPPLEISSTVETITDYLVHSKHQDTLIYKFFELLMDGIVYELYFPDEIQAAGKQILPHLANLQSITEDMSEEEKLAVIHREFERLYDPHHPVRNNLETLDSVEEVRIIREALKK